MSMRAIKVAVAEALASDDDVAKLVPASQVFTTERSVVPTLPSVEVVAISSESQEGGPLIRHLAGC